MLEPRHIPNIITIFRLILVPPVAWAILEGDYRTAFWLFFIAGFSDGLDGFLARFFGWQSKLGATLDPIADKLLMICSFYCLFWMGLIPWWLFVVVLFRDLIILSGAIAYHFVTRELRMEPILVGKLNTGIQIFLILAILLHQTFGIPGEGVIITLTWLLMLSTLISGAAYVYIWSKKTRTLKAAE